MKKKLAAAFLATAMMAGVIAAPAAAEEMVTVSLYIPTLANYSEDAITEVEAALNEMLAEKYGIQVDLHYIEFGNFETSINLAMTTDELDVTCFFDQDGGLSKYVNNGQLLDITDYFNNASEEFRSTFTEAECLKSSINGRMYSVARKFQYGGKGVVLMNAAIVEELGIDPLSVTDMDSLGEVLYQVHEAHPEIYALAPQSSADISWVEPWDKGVGGTIFLFTDSVESTELGSLFELDSFAEFCSYTHQWYEDGLIMSDILSNTMEGAPLVNSGAAFACFVNADIDPANAAYPNTVVSGDLIAPRATASDIGNLQYGISANSAHPDEAFKLLEAIYTDEEIVTTLCYGIEGEHYILNEDGRADFPEGISSENEPYGGFVATAVYPNYMLAPVKASATVDNYQEAVDEWNNSLTVSANVGFLFDISEYTDFVTAYTNLKDKYYYAVKGGTVALEDVLPSIQSELEAIGFYDVLAEAQSELDAYLETK
ncbi:MAG: ABC transporter substrate-binding protein [Eubacteriales bacterium]|nr:ABC transporter substrate-binding protein [Eubacteriales bacterium]